MAGIAVYGGLFLSALVAATILPAQSEAVLAALLLEGSRPAALLVAVASLGNVLGSVVNYMIGRGAARFAQRRWFPVRGDALGRAEAWYRRWGRWSLLLSWVPIVGDPLTVAAGVLREPVWSFVALVTLAKAGRYLVLAALVLGTVAH